MIIQMSRPFANHHPDGSAFCKWSSRFLPFNRFFSIVVSKSQGQGLISSTFLEQCVLVLATTILPPHLLLAKQTRKVGAEDIMPSTRKRQSSSSRVLLFTQVDFTLCFLNSSLLFFGELVKRKTRNLPSEKVTQPLPLTKPLLTKPFERLWYWGQIAVTRASKML